MFKNFDDVADDEEIVIDEDSVDTNLAEEFIDDDSEKNVTRQKSKAEEKIIALKRELKEAKEKLRAQSGDERKSAIDSYVSKGYDESTAEIHADTELKLKAIGEKLELQEFKEANASVLSKYPSANDNLKWIMDVSKATGMSAEEICRGKFSNEYSTIEQRNKDAVLEEQPSTAPANVSKAMRGAMTGESVSLNAEDRRNKEFFEKLVGKMTEKEYLEMKTRRGL